MSGVTTSFDTFLARLTAIYPTHKRLSNPYKAEENSELVLNKGFGLAFGASTNSNRQISCQLSYQRDFIVVLTRVVRANEFAISKKDDTAKSLVEDWFLLVESVEKDPTLDVAGNQTNLQYVSDNGVEFVFSEKDNFYKIETTISLEIFENLI